MKEKAKEKEKVKPIRVKDKKLNRKVYIMKGGWAHGGINE
jgi:hypothetical protein|tara:strand:+ start:2166 stop:2285 length:120 start_codon:yes stop_codon:yes gene_type:complete